MSRENILDAIREAARANRGRVPGERAFLGQIGITKRELWSAGFSRYSEAVQAAGLQPNTMQSAFEESKMLLPLADLVRKLGKFPTRGEFMSARSGRNDLPSYEAFIRLADGAYRNLPGRLLKYCNGNVQLADVSAILEASGGGNPESIVREMPESARVRGYVYLLRHGQRGREYKIGKSNNVARRRQEIALLLPQELVHVHLIETDDPDGIEQYWLRRFKPKHLRGEWHSLSPDDVAAFKRRRYQ